MRCPKCRSWLDEIELEGVTVDRCGDCRGVWFDAEELEQFRRARGDAEKTPVSIDSEEPELECPRCEQVTLRPGTSGETTLHGCQHCHGLFLPGSAFPKPSSVGKSAVAVIEGFLDLCVGWIPI